MNLVKHLQNVIVSCLCQIYNPTTLERKSLTTKWNRVWWLMGLTVNLHCLFWMAEIKRTLFTTWSLDVLWKASTSLSLIQWNEVKHVASRQFLGTERSNRCYYSAICLVKPNRTDLFKSYRVLCRPHGRGKGD